jgi:uncharacterized membrane protein
MTAEETDEGQAVSPAEAPRTHADARGSDNPQRVEPAGLPGSAKEVAKDPGGTHGLGSTVVDTHEPTQPRGARGTIEVRTRELSEFHAGPIPPAATLEAYEQLVPGSARRIVRNALTQSAHRRKLESEVVRADIRQAWYGLWIGAIVAAAALLGGMGLVVFGHDVAGTTIVGTSLVGLVGVFIYGTRTRRQERDEKAAAVKRMMEDMKRMMDEMGAVHPTKDG